MVDCNYKSPTRSYATIFKTQPWKQAVSTFPQGASPLHLSSKLIFCPHQKKYISTTHQANLPESESPLEEEKTFWRTLRSDLHEAEVLSGFLLQRCHPLWRRGFGQRCGRCSWCWQGVQRSVESWACVSACEPVGLWACEPVSLWACVSLTPGLAPCHSHVHFAKQKLKRGKKQ